MPQAERGARERSLTRPGDAPKLGIVAEDVARRPGVQRVDVGFGAKGAVRRPGAPNVNLEIRAEASTAELVREAIAEARELMQIEVALAREELRFDVDRARQSAMALGAAVGAAVFGALMLLVALSLALSRGPIPALVIGLVLVMLAATFGLVGYGRVPRRPMERTRARLLADAHLFKERVG